MNRRHILIAAACLAVTLPVFAQTYPNKPIRLIVPFAPGGTTDVVARSVADPLARLLGQPVVVENRGGGGGIIGATELARAAPDGYSLGIATVSTVATNPAVNSKVSYNPITDFTPITNIAATPSVVAVTPNFAGKDWKSFIAEIKRSPGKYSYASSGTGGIQHMMMEMLKSQTRTEITHIPYRGAGPALTDTVAGQVEMTLDQLPSALPFIKNNRLIPIVIAAPKRLSFLPNVPTFAEIGLPQMNRMAFYGVVGPKGMSEELVGKINTALVKVLADPAVRKRIEDTGSIVVANTPEEFAAQIKEEFEIYRGVAQKQKISLD